MKLTALEELDCCEPYCVKLDIWSWNVVSAACAWLVLPLVIAASTLDRKVLRGSLLLSLLLLLA